MDIDLYGDLESGLELSGKRIPNNSPFVRAGKFLHDLYRKGVEDALAVHIGPAVYIVHSGLEDIDDAFVFSDVVDPKELSVAEVLRVQRQDTDVTAKCLTAFSRRLLG